MALVIGYISALAYWRNLAITQAPNPRRSRSCTLPRHVLIPDSEAASSILTALGVEAPLHVLISNATEPSIVKGTHPHAWSAPILPGSLVECEDDVVGGMFASSPEFVFLQMAQTLNLIQLIEVGFELCGGYSLTNVVPEGFVARKPLTTVNKIRAFLDKAEGIHGIKKAKRAIDNVLPGSESPRETAQAMLLCLPYLLGGYKLGNPILNYTILLGKRAQAIAGKRFRRCDLYWPEQKLAVEYESDAHHTGSTRIANDSKRRNELSYMDITVITVTRKQINNLYELHKVACILAKHLGKRLRPRTKQFAMKQLELRAMVLSSTGPHKPKPLNNTHASRRSTTSVCTGSRR